MSKRAYLDQKVEMTQKMRDDDLRYKKELENLKRKDRQETVERIAKI